MASIDDGHFAQAGALIEEILPASRPLEEPSRWGLTLMLRALGRPYASDSPARGWALGDAEPSEAW